MKITKMKNVQPNQLKTLESLLVKIYHDLIDVILYCIAVIFSTILISYQPSTYIPCILLLLIIRLIQIYKDFKMFCESDWKGVVASFTVLMICYCIGQSNDYDIITYGGTMILGNYLFRMPNHDVLDISFRKPT